jgi:murein DD-endopeptidase MepM/ murein hydrolase activator NlpD
MSNKGLSGYVIIFSMIIPMAMYVDTNEKLMAAQGGVVVLDDGTEISKNAYLSLAGGVGGPAVGLSDIIETTPLLNNSGAPAEIVKVDEFEGAPNGNGINNSENTKKLVYLKIAETVWPVETVAISSDFGWRTAPCDGCSSDHQGVDFVPGAGTKVFSVYQGIVTKAGWDGGYGNRIEVMHYVKGADGKVQQWVTLYAHMQNNSMPADVYVGAVVKTGAVLGKVGSTGISTGPHLHFELIIDGENVDPMPVLGHYSLIELTEEEAAQYTFSSNVRELDFTRNR